MSHAQHLVPGLLAAALCALAPGRAHAQHHAVVHPHATPRGTPRATPHARSPCLAPAVEIRRINDAHTHWVGALTNCAGRPRARALAALSLIARAEHPTER